MTSPGKVSFNSGSNKLLKAYVRVLTFSGEIMRSDIATLVATWRFPREGRVWTGLS